MLSKPLPIFIFLSLISCDQKKTKQESVVEAEEIAVLTPEQEKVVEAFCLEFAENIKSANGSATAEAFNTSGTPSTTNVHPDASNGWGRPPCQYGLGSFGLRNSPCPDV